MSSTVHKDSVVQFVRYSTFILLKKTKLLKLAFYSDLRQNICLVFYIVF